MLSSLAVTFLLLLGADPVVTCQALDCTTTPAGCAVSPCRSTDSVPVTTPLIELPAEAPTARFAG